VAVILLGVLQYARGVKEEDKANHDNVCVFFLCESTSSESTHCIEANGQWIGLDMHEWIGVSERLIICPRLLPLLEVLNVR